MNKTNHCKLCDHQAYDFNIGSRCGLTNKKPDFESFCSDILLTKKFEDKIEEVNIEYARVKKLKPHAVYQSVVYTSLAVGIILAGYLLGKFILEKRVISTIPIIIMGVGLLAMPTAFGPINSYRSQMSIAKTKKEDVDNVVDLYGIYYSIEVKFGREYHGTTEAIVKLDLKRKTSYNNRL